MGVVEWARGRLRQRRDLIEWATVEEDDTERVGAEPGDDEADREGTGPKVEEKSRGTNAPPTPDGPTPEWNPSSRYTIENQLPRRLEILGDDKHIIMMAPLERRDAPGQSLVPFAKSQLELAGEVVVTEKTRSEIALDGVLGLGVWAVIGYFVVGSVVDQPWFWLGVPALGLVLLFVLWMTVKRGGMEILRWMKQAVSLLLVFVTAVGIPGVMIWYGAEVDEIAEGMGSPAQLFGTSPALLGRGMQLLVISTASLLPALMYFLFDREQLGTLRDRFLQQAFRLDPTLDRLSDLQAKYGAQVDEIYGSQEAGRARLLGGRLSPIFIATLLITVGWTLTLLNADVQPDPEGGIPLLALFQPERSVVTFAFLGAYFFAVQLVLRGYMRGDLRAKSYSHISVRILIVVILAWILQEVVGTDTTGLLVLVFLAGVVPETAVRWILEVPRRLGWSLKGLTALNELAPLTELEGIDLYDRTRLMDEGVTNVEALAHHDFVDLMLRTRIPGARLVDWLDQAILHLHTRSKLESQDEEHPAEGSAAPNQTDEDLWVSVHRYGIRTATDLIKVAGDPPDDRLLAAMGRQGSDDPPVRLKIALEAMQDDEWLECVRHWRQRPDPVKTKELLEARHRSEPVPTTSVMEVSTATPTA